MTIDVDGALQAGDRMSARWRWHPERPLLALGIALPAPGRLSGIIALDALWERRVVSRDVVVMWRRHGWARRRARLSLADWAPRGTWHWRVGAALDTFDDDARMAPPMRRSPGAPSPIAS